VVGVSWWGAPACPAPAPLLGRSCTCAAQAAAQSTCRVCSTHTCLTATANFNRSASNDLTADPVLLVLLSLLRLRERCDGPVGRSGEAFGCD
jgi:hypothetical protein